MQIQTPCALVPLARHRTQRLQAGPGTRVRGLRGTTWVTIDHDRRDLVLQAGDQVTLTSGAPVILSPLGGDALVEVADPQPHLPLAPAISPLAWQGWRRAGQWLLRRAGAARRRWSTA